MTVRRYRAPGTVFTRKYRQGGLLTGSQRKYRYEMANNELVVPNDTTTGDWRWAYSAGWSISATEHYSSTAGSTATLHFTGVGARIYGTLDVHHGNAEVRVDGVLVASVAANSATRTRGAVLYDTGTVTDAAHTVQLTVVGNGTIAIDGAVVSASAPIIIAPPPTGSLLLDEQFTLQGSWVSEPSNAGHPNWFFENSEDERPFVVGSDGIARITGNTYTHVSGGYWRAWSKARFGGRGKSIRIRARVRATTLYTGSHTPGVNLGLKFPRDQALTGYSVDDPQSVRGFGDAGSPAYYLFRHGVNVDGMMEMITRQPGAGDIYSGTARQYTSISPTQWRTVMIRVDWPENTDDIVVKWWHNTDDENVTPAFSYRRTDTAVEFDRPAYLWLRTDNADFEYDSVTVEDITTIGYGNDYGNNYGGPA